jgi:hypothetical protein
MCCCCCCYCCCCCCRFASKYPGNYATLVPDAASFYKSNNYMDDIAWNAAWLFIRTGNVVYRSVP